MGAGSTRDKEFITSQGLGTEGIRDRECIASWRRGQGVSGTENALPLRDRACDSLDSMDGTSWLISQTKGHCF